MSGRENLVPGRQYVVMMNHVNFFDPLVFYAAFPGIARGVEEESHFRWPVYGGTIRRIGMFPINRKNPDRAVESLRRAAAWIRERPDFSFGILPEGTRTRDGKLGPFKRGGFLLAVETGLDILPIVQSGAFEIARKGSLLIRPGRVDVAIEPAVPVAGYTKENVGELIERVRGVFLERLGIRPSQSSGPLFGSSPDSGISLSPAGSGYASSSPAPLRREADSWERPGRIVAEHSKLRFCEISGERCSLQMSPRSLAPSRSARLLIVASQTPLPAGPPLQQRGSSRQHPSPPREESRKWEMNPLPDREPLMRWNSVCRPAGKRTPAAVKTALCSRARWISWSPHSGMTAATPSSTAQQVSA